MRARSCPRYFLLCPSCSVLMSVSHRPPTLMSPHLFGVQGTSIDRTSLPDSKKEEGLSASAAGDPSIKAQAATYDSSHY
jgi:hypothetical protein